MHTPPNTIPHRLHRAWTGLAAGSLVLAACGGGDDAAPEPVKTAVSTIAPDVSQASDDATPPATDDVEPEATETEDDDAGADEGDDEGANASDADDLADRQPPNSFPDPGPKPEVVSGVPESSPTSPASITGAAFAWSGQSATSDVVLHGLVEGSHVSSEAEGRCVFVLGTATPNWIRNSDLFAGSVQFPKVGLLVGGEYLKTDSKCDDAPLLEAGYSVFGSDGVTLGAPYSFAEGFFIEGATPAAIDAVVLGSETDPAEFGPDDENSYFDATVIPTVPVRTAPPADLASPDLAPLAGQTILAGTSDVWEITFDGFFEREPSQFGIDQNGPGTCMVLTGTAAPAIIEGGAIADTRPRMHLLAAGEAMRNLGFCETDDLTDAGHRRSTNAFTVGSSQSFMDVFFVPDILADSMTTLVVDGPGEWRQTFALDMIDGPAAPISLAAAGSLPPTAGAMNDATTTMFTLSAGDPINWEVVTSGLVDLGPSRDGAATCYAVVGQMTADVEVTSAGAIPDFTLIANGEEFGGSTDSCDTEALDAIVAQGYTLKHEFPLAADTTTDFVQRMLVPNDPARTLDVFVIGDASNDERVAYLDPAIIAAAPTI